VKLQERISTLLQLGEYLSANEENWQYARHRATLANPWFIPEFIDLAVENITRFFLQKEALENWAVQYGIPEENPAPARIGLTMAGNIPLVGFHDWLTLFMAGQRMVIKPSSKDEILIKHIVEKMAEINPGISDVMEFADRLAGCDAYIATGSNNSGRYFEYYFGKYPHIIRRNRTSAAILTGNETNEDLFLLADDMLLYFGLGCRNVSKLYVPRGYQWEPLLRAADRYAWMKDHNKFRNNYDYQLSLHILNNKYYMSNEAILLIENPGLFSPIAQVHYEYYDAIPENLLQEYPEQLQCVAGTTGIPFGQAQKPSLTDYADGVDTMAFALGVKGGG
jgi:hypothetical protein